MNDHDDWRDETQLRLSRNPIYIALKNKCVDDPAGVHVMALVDDATYYAYHRTKTISRHMGEFTLHDGEHLFRVLRLMSLLIPDECIDELTIPELLLLILSAFFHDLGMAPSESTVLTWLKSWDREPDISKPEEMEELGQFKRYLSTEKDIQEIISDYIKSEKMSDALQARGHLLSNYIRQTHADRSRTIIEEDWNGKIKYRDTDLTSEFAAICFNHNEDPLSSLEFDLRHLCGPGTPACLRLVAVILRLADVLDFDAKRTPAVLFSHLYVRHPVSINEWKKHQSIEAWEINGQSISFHAKCKHPAIESAIHAFCDLIDKELSGCNNVISTINDHFKTNNRNITINLPFRVDRSKIQTAKNIRGNPLYSYRETQFRLSKSRVIDLLMGTKLYGDPEVALRELIQNSIDACLLRSAMEKNWGNSYEPEILVKYSKVDGEDILEVTDNGTGMDQYIIDNYYSTIGSSYYKSGDFYRLKAESNASFNPTSRFGIGILSCFMVADSIIVDTRKVRGPHESSDPLHIIIEGQESIFWIKPGTLKKPGTTTRLHLRRNANPWQKMSEKQFTKSVENVIPNPPFRITIETEHEKKLRDQSSFKKIKATSLKNHSWEVHPNIKMISMDFDDPSDGFVGSAVVGLLQKRALPVAKLEMTRKSVRIDGIPYDLEKSMSLAGKSININTTSITINEDGNVEDSSNSNSLCESMGRISLHGIEIPMKLFPDYWTIQRNQISLQWPFPVLLVIDVCGKSDLDLNSSRTQILQGNKWNEFEIKLAQKILLGIKESVTPAYWKLLVPILHAKSKGGLFRDALKNF